MSKSRIPEGLDVTESRAIFDLLRNVDELQPRMDKVSRHFLDRPYIAGSLGGGPDLIERFIARLDGFDCVTYMETVLAFAASNSIEQFIKTLREIRYENGQVDWLKRNHYMTAWVSNNIKQGFIKNITRGSEAVEAIRALNVVEGLPALDVKFRYFRKESYSRVRETIKNGDLVLLVSTKKRLDVFHTGLLFLDDKKVMMRHASRTAGKVIEQSLKEFLKSHRMSGFILLRPLWRK